MLYNEVPYSAVLYDAVLCRAVLCCDCCNLGAGGQQHRYGEQNRWQEQTSACIIRVQ